MRSSAGIVARAVLDLDAIRSRFPALASGAAFFDGPGGSQVPQQVIDAMTGYLRDSNANLGGAFATSRGVGRGDGARRAPRPPTSWAASPRASPSGRT